MLNTGKQCKAHKRDGSQCTNIVVDGYEVCRMHGAGGGRPVKTATFTEVAPKSLADKISEYRKTISLEDAEEVIATSRTLIVEYINRFDENVNVTRDDIQYLIQWCESVVRQVSRIIDTRLKSTITVAEVELIQTVIANLADKYVEESKRPLFFQELKQLTGNASERN